MLYINHLSKNYGAFLAVNDLSLHVPKGDLFGFVGPNGAGKTTTIRMICGLLKPAFGSISIAGYEQRRQSMELKRKIDNIVITIIPWKRVVFGRLFWEKEQICLIPHRKKSNYLCYTIYCVG